MPRKVSLSVSVSPELSKAMKELCELFGVFGDVRRLIPGWNGFPPRISREFDVFLKHHERFVVLREVNPRGKSAGRAHKVEWRLCPTDRMTKLVSALRALVPEVEQVVIAAFHGSSPVSVE